MSDLRSLVLPPLSFPFSLPFQGQMAQRWRLWRPLLSQAELRLHGRSGFFSSCFSSSFSRQISYCSFFFLDAPCKFLFTQ